MSNAPAPVARLSPCPCGSGKRYKDCHGASAKSSGALPSAANPPPSAYRPSGAEWNLLPEAERDRLGALMEAALVHQREGRAHEADRLYRDVLAVVPRTHDALHMLGMARWSQGDYTEARRRIEEALSLRPGYPTILQNHLLVVSAERARERSVLEESSEKALPPLVERLRLSSSSGRAQPASADSTDSEDATIHLIGADDESVGDDAWMLRRLATLLEPLRPVIWPTQREDVATARDESHVPFPAGGVQVWVGVDAAVATWLEKSHPHRTLVLAQGAPPSRWLEMLRAIAVDGARPLELVVGSRAKAERFGGAHVLPIPLDLAEFAVTKPDDSAEFVVGTVAQTGREVRSPRTGSLQEQVATAGIRLDVYDPGRLRNVLGGLRHVRCISRHDVSLAHFLARLSCYLYCCDAWWDEGLGRDLFGAMALGILVLCPRTSIHAEYIRDGVDGILYDDDAGALEALASLRSDPARRAAMGAAARDSAQRRFDGREIAHAYRRLVTGT